MSTVEYRDFGSGKVSKLETGHIVSGWYYKVEDTPRKPDPFYRTLDTHSIITGFDLHHWRFKFLVDGVLVLQAGVCSLDEMQETIHRWISHSRGLLDDVERTQDTVLPVFSPRVNAWA